MARAHGEVVGRPGCPLVPGGAGKLEQQGMIDAERIGRIGPLIPGHTVTEEDAGRQRHSHPVEIDLPPWILVAVLPCAAGCSALAAPSPSRPRRRWTSWPWSSSATSAELRSRSLLLSRAQRDQLDLLPAELDLELIAWLEPQLGGAGLPHQLLPASDPG